jgi:beta-glucosidase
VGSTAAGLPFCDHTKPVADRVVDLVSRLTREEKINLVQQADTGFLPRLNLKEFNFFNTCLHGWWTTNVTTFGMPVGMAATFDTAVMRQIAEVIGVESRALSQRDYVASFDPATQLHGVAVNWLVCKDAAEVNMNRHPLWGRNPETVSGVGGGVACLRARAGAHHACAYPWECVHVGGRLRVNACACGHPRPTACPYAV